MNDVPAQDANATRLAEALARAEQVTEDLKSSRAQLDGIITNAATELKALTEERAKSEARAATLASELDKLGKDREAVADIVGRIQAIEETSRNTADAAAAESKKIEAARAHCDELAKQFEAANDNIRKQSSDAENDVKSLRGEIDTLGKERDNLKSVLAEAQSTQTAIQKSKEAIQADVQAITTTKAAFEKLRTETDAVQTDLKNRQTQVNTKAAEVDTAHTQVMQQVQALLKDATPDGKAAKSIATQIRELNNQSKAELTKIQQQASAAKTEHETLSTDIKTQWDAMKEALEDKQKKLLEASTAEVAALKSELASEIRQLLPGAGAAGLASAYYDAKLNYGPGKFEYHGPRTGKNSGAKVLAAWAAYQIRTFATPFMFYLLFIGPLVVVAYFFYELMNFVMQHPKDFNAEYFIFRVLLTLPLATISWFGWSSIRLHRRLYEEYNHKQRVMQLYDSFKKEIEKSGTPEQEKALLAVMLATVSDKPSLAMHKYDGASELKTGDFSWGALLDQILKDAKGSSA